ncbi:F-box domain [Arabidopsis thaliana x Arabidopsis arenosa]|uniref:F-box domain n=1 Tax=Arabidopsis thaliana x Arabidopsis arenosa TaxID=1240361 RepID=A0A8T2ART2_9BRAS|nr:F-box domain [Arabidopsis thaliana x Arabidopsis arenosa]
MTTISDLPKELVEEIISRVPMKSMRAVRFTCKKWNHNNTRLVVWNPYCGQTRSIELRYSYISVKGCDTCSYAFGYVEKLKKNKSRRNHKILRFKDNDVSYNERDNFMCKFLTVNTGPETLESFIIDEEKKVAMVLDDETFYILGEAGYFRELDLREPNHKGCYTHMCSYVPNLVQIKRPAGGGKRKLQSSLEKRRYDQKTSRLVALDKRIKK